MTKSELLKMKKEDLAAFAKKEGVKLGDRMPREKMIDAILASGKVAAGKRGPGSKPAARPKAAQKSPEGAGAKILPLKKPAPESPRPSKTPNFHEMSDTIYGESKKFEIEDKRGYSEPSYELAGEKPYELPEEYGETRITLLVQDPYWVHAYWEINAETRRQYSLEKGRHSKKVVVRVYRQDNGAFFDVPVQDTARNWYFNVPQSNAAYYAELGVLESNKVFYRIARSNPVFIPSDRAADDQSLPTREREQVEELFRQSGGHVIHKLVGSETVSQWTAGLSGVSSGVSSGSGGMVFPQAPNRSFWAELSTELIVHGATQPDAKVTVGGFPVKLSPDGKFSIRFILNDGGHSVPFVAVSRDNVDKIEITPFVNKNTERKDSRIG